MEFGLEDLQKEFGDKRDSLERLFSQALYEFYEYEAWGELTEPGGLYDQPYEWKMGVETVRIAKRHFENEEKIRELRYQQQLEEMAEEGGDPSGEYGV